MSQPDWQGTAAQYLAASGQPLTLGQAAGGTPLPAPAPGQLQGSTNYLQEFQQAMQAVQPMLQPAMRQPLPPSDPPSLMRNIFTFGQAGIDYHNYLNHYNAGVDQWNRQLQLKGAELAGRMVDAQAQGKSQELNQMMRMLGLKMQALGLEQQMHNQNWREGDAALKHQLNPQEQKMRDFLGKDAAGNYQDPMGGEPPAPGSAFDEARRAAGGGGTTGEETDTSLRPKPGETFTEYERRGKIAEKLAVPTTQTRRMSEVAPDVLFLVSQVEDSLKKVKTGPLASRIQAGRVAIGMPDANFKAYQANAELLKTSLMNMHTGSRSSDLLMRNFGAMIDENKAAPENMQAVLNQIRAYATHKGAKLGKPIPTGSEAETTTTTSTVPPSTGTGKFSPLESMLKKYGY